MFGTSAFAQTPFAALAAGFTFDADVLEAGVAEASAPSTTATFVALNAATGSTAATQNTINNIFNNFVVDGVSGSSAQAPLIIFGGSVSEAASGANVPTSQVDFVAVRGELGYAAVSDLTNTAVFVATDAEGASGAQDVNRIATVYADQDASAAVGSSTSAAVLFTGTVAEFAAAIETMSVERIANLFVSGVQMSVFMGTVTVWGPIPTGPAGPWVVIPNTIPVAWANTNVAPDPNWS